MWPISTFWTKNKRDSFRRKRVWMRTNGKKKGTLVKVRKKKLALRHGYWYEKKIESNLKDVKSEEKKKNFYLHVKIDSIWRKRKKVLSHSPLDHRTQNFKSTKPTKKVYSKSFKFSFVKSLFYCQVLLEQSYCKKKKTTFSHLFWLILTNFLEPPKKFK